MGRPHIHRGLAGLLALGLFVPAEAGSGQCLLPFGLPQYQITGSPRKIAVGDLNGDGINDIVATQDGETDIAVLLSAGGGSFHPPIYLPVGGTPYGLAIGNFDNAGGLDLAIAVSNASKIALFSGDGMGNLTPQPDLVVPQGQRDIAAGDVNGDGVDDLAWLGISDKTAHVYENDGAGTFTLWGSAAFLYGPYALTLGDQNGDGFAELAVVEAQGSNPLFGPGTLYFYANLGDSMGVWQGLAPIPANTSTSPYPEHVRFAQLGGPAGLEVVVTTNALGDDLGWVDVLSDPAGGVFQSVDSYLTGISGPSSATGDLDGDGFADIATISSINHDVVSVLMNNGDATFAPPVDYDTPGNHLFLSIELSDLDGDGDLDGVVGGISGRTVNALANRGDGTFDVPGSVPTGDGPNTIQAADFNKDDNLDLIATTNDSGGTLFLHLGNGDGTFQTPAQFPGQAVWGATAAADVNNDTWPDIITCSAGIVTPLINDTLGGFTPGSPTPAIPNMDTIKGVEVGDFNGDTRPDLAVAFFATAYPWNRLRILLNDGMGGYTLGDVRNIGSNGFETHAHDVDGDTDIDLIVLRPYIFDGVTVYYNDGAGVFAAQTEFGSFDPPAHNGGSVSMATGDLDGDDDIDIAIVNSFTLNVSVLLNDGSGSYTTLPPIDIGVRLFGIDAADMTGDGIPDLVVGVNQGNTIDQQSMYGAVLLPGAGDGTFGDAVHFAASIGPWDLTCADVNNDGRPDALLACLSADSIDILLNNGCLGVSEPCPGNANGDSIVDFDDIVAVLGNWLADYSPGTGTGDADGSGTVDFDDIVAILGNWLSPCP